MNRRIIYTRPDGGVSVVIPCKGYNEQHLTDDEVFQRAWDMLHRSNEVVQSWEPDPEESLLPTGIAINPQIVTIDQIPSDRAFRDAWEHEGDKIAVNMDKARDIHMDNIRTVRNKALADLDVETIKAVGKSDSKALDDVEAKKQALRDIPQTFDLSAARTPEELKNLWPTELETHDFYIT